MSSLRISWPSAWSWVTAAPMYRVVQSTMALRTKPSAPSWSSIPSRYAWWIVPRLPWHTSRASLCRASCTVSCRFVCRR